MNSALESESRLDRTDKYQLKGVRKSVKKEGSRNRTMSPMDKSGFSFNNNKQQNLPSIKSHSRTPSKQTKGEYQPLMSLNSIQSSMHKSQSTAHFKGNNTMTIQSMIPSLQPIHTSSLNNPRPPRPRNENKQNLQMGTQDSIKSLVSITSTTSPISGQISPGSPAGIQSGLGRNRAHNLISNFALSANKYLRGTIPTEESEFPCVLHPGKVGRYLCRAGACGRLPICEWCRVERHIGHNSISIFQLGREMMEKLKERINVEKEYKMKVEKEELVIRREGNKLKRVLSDYMEMFQDIGVRVSKAITQAINSLTEIQDEISNIVCNKSSLIKKESGESVKVSERIQYQLGIVNELVGNMDEDQLLPLALRKLYGRHKSFEGFVQEVKREHIVFEGVFEIGKEEQKAWGEHLEVVKEKTGEIEKELNIHMEQSAGGAHSLGPQQSWKDELSFTLSEHENTTYNQVTVKEIPFSGGANNFCDTLKHDLHLPQPPTLKNSVIIPLQTTMTTPVGRGKYGRKSPGECDNDSPQLHYFLHNINKCPRLHMLNLHTLHTKEYVLKDLAGLIGFYSISISNKEIFLCGGEREGIYQLSSYNIKLKENPIISRRGDLNESRTFHTMVYKPPHIYIIGGFNGSNNICSVEKYNTKSNIYKYTKSMNEPKSSVGGCLFCSRYIYIFGGATGEFVKTIECLDTEKETNGWRIVNIDWAPGWVERYGLGAVPLNDSTILIMGGGDSTSFLYTPRGDGGTIRKCINPAPMFEYFSNSCSYLYSWGGGVYILGSYSHNLYYYNVPAGTWGYSTMQQKGRLDTNYLLVDNTK